MATLILSTIGAVVGGPIGQAVGAIAGSVIDRAVLNGGGGGTRRVEGARRADLFIQNATYGEPLPLVYGRYRLAGSVIWSTGLVERRTDQRSGGGKRGTTVTTTYSYFASFAVALAARQSVRIERIWADGKLIRADNTSALTVGGALRFYNGSETQMPDPLIEAAVGLDLAPAHRGLSYVVFDDLPLQEFANRVPNLTIELVADDGSDITAGVIASDIARRAGLRGFAAEGLDQPVAGFAISSDAPARTTLAALNTAARFAVVSTPGGLSARVEGATLQPLLQASDICAGLEPADGPANGPANGTDSGARYAREPAAALPSTVEVSYLDPARGYQTGLQRARGGPSAPGASISLALPFALSAVQAKQVAERSLAQARRARDTLAVNVPLSRADLAPGSVFALGPAPGQLWAVRTRRFEGGQFALGCARWSARDQGLALAADGGAPVDPGTTVHGPTVAQLMDLPPLEPALPTSARLVFAASGPERGWRQASLWRSADGGASYALVSSTLTNTVMGTARTALPAASAHLWDTRNSLDVELLTDGDTLLSQPEIAVLGGANLALLGDELIQFRSAVAIAPRQFRLTGLLRGRRGTESAMASHSVAERFVLLDPLPPAIDVPPIAAIGQTLFYKALSPNTALAQVDAIAVPWLAHALRPLSPVHATVDASLADWSIRWIRRSRNGFGWADGTDAPLAEEAERYRVSVLAGDTVVRSFDVVEPALVYAAADRAADRAGRQGPWQLRIGQISADVGLGATLTIALPA